MPTLLSLRAPPSEVMPLSTFLMMQGCSTTEMARDGMSNHGANWLPSSWLTAASAEGIMDVQWLWVLELQLCLLHVLQGWRRWRPPALHSTQQKREVMRWACNRPATGSSGLVCACSNSTSTYPSPPSWPLPTASCGVHCCRGVSLPPRLARVWCEMAVLLFHTSHPKPPSPARVDDLTTSPLASSSSFIRTPSSPAPVS
jgi:hypothetical protein